MDSARSDVRSLVEVAGLRPDNRILDVGCGTGRLAAGLVEYLDDRGSYDGFDVRDEAVSWARANVAGGDRRFRFHHVDVRSPSYNPDGTTDASRVRFPYEDESFDLVVLLSVFSHMVPEDIRNYLGEISRVLESGGRCVATFFLLSAPQTVETPHQTLAIVHDAGGYFLADPRVPEKAVGVPEPFVRRSSAQVGLKVGAVHQGKWRNSGGYRWQDTVVLRKS